MPPTSYTLVNALRSTESFNRQLPGYIAVKLAKRNFEKQIAKKIKSDPKSFYSYFKSKTKFKSAVGPLTNNNGDLVGDYKEMAELLNTFLHLCLLQKIPITYQISY